MAFFGWRVYFGDGRVDSISDFLRNVGTTVDSTHYINNGLFVVH